MPKRRWPTAFASALLLAVGGGAAAGAVADAAAPGSDERRTARHLEAIRDDPAKLHGFLAAMPKGADLHNHLSGAVPTETLIGYAVEDGLCIDTTTLTALPAPPPAGACPAGQRPAAESSVDPGVLRPDPAGVVDGGLRRRGGDRP